MKILTANFLTCAVKACKASTAAFPLHFRDAELERAEMDYNPLFLRNLLPRVEWDALRSTAAELGFTNLPERKPFVPQEVVSTTTDEKAAAEGEAKEVEMGEAGRGEEDVKEIEMQEEDDGTGRDDEEKLLRTLHEVLLETSVMEGKMVCGNCGHEYRIKEGIANFLLPGHLV